MILEQMSLLASSGRRQQVASALASTMGPIQVQPGCLSCHLFQCLENPDEFLITAKWASADGLISHLQSDTYKQLLLLMELSPDPPVIEFYTVVETQGLNLVQHARKCSG